MSVLPHINVEQPQRCFRTASCRCLMIEKMSISHAWIQDSDQAFYRRGGQFLKAGGLDRDFAACTPSSLCRSGATQSFSSERFVFLHNLWGLGSRNFFELFCSCKSLGLRYLRLEGFLVESAKVYCFEIRHAILAKFSNFPVLAIEFGPSDRTSS